MKRPAREYTQKSRVSTCASAARQPLSTLKPKNEREHVKPRSGNNFKREIQVDQEDQVKRLSSTEGWDSAHLNIRSDERDTSKQRKEETDRDQIFLNLVCRIERVSELYERGNAFKYIGAPGVL